MVRVDRTKRGGSATARARKTDAHARRVTPVWAKILLALAATALALVACELAIRLVGTTPEVIPIGITSDDCIYQRSRDPYLSYELKPNYRNDAADLKFDHPRTNSDGLRDVQRTLEKPSAVKRVILLGDSVVVGFGIREIDDLMSRQLEKLFPAGDVQVLNLAVSGYCTRAEVELLKVKGIQYHPDLVILVFVENDFYNFNREARYTDGIAERPRIINSLYRGSHLFRTACLKLNLFGFGIETDPARWNQRAMGDNNVSDGFQVLRDLALRHGFETIIAVWPAFTNSEITYNDMMFMPGTHDQLIVDRLARMHGLTTVHLDQPFRQHWQSLIPRPNPRIYYTVDGDQMHPNLAGQRAAAAIFKKIITDRQLLQPSSSPRTVSAPVADDPAAVQAAKALGEEESDYSALHYNLGKELMKKGKIDEAIRELEETIRLNRNYAADAHNDIGFIFFERGRTGEAIRHYQQALAINPENYFALVNLGNALRTEGRIGEAIRQYRRAIRLRPERLAGQYNLGSTLASQGNYAEAATHFALAAKIDPTDAKVARRLGQAYLQLGRLDQAIAQLRRAAQLNPDRGATHNQLGLALVRSGRPGEAIEAFRQGLQAEPDNAELHFNLGKALSTRGGLGEAARHLQKACDLSPANANAHNSLGVVLAKMGRVDEAIRQFSQALQLDPNNQNARRNLTNARAMPPSVVP